MFDFIKQKVKVFISSKCGDEYTIVRKALANLLEETNLCSVYVFEEDYATTRHVVSSYLNELQDSDLVIFFIENSDGVTDPVQSEIDRARELKKKCLFFFCDEKSKERTQLQNDIFSGLLERTNDVHEFSEFPKMAYQSAMTEIVKIYQKYCNGILVDSNLNNEKEREVKIDVKDPVIVEKERIKGFLYTRSVLIKKILMYSEKCENVSKEDQAFGDMLEVVLGDKDIFQVNYSIICDYVLKYYDGEMKNVMKYRLEAVYQYWLGNMEKGLQELRLAMDIAEREKNIPRWVINDIAIDLRNVQILIDKSNEVVNLYSEGQKILDKDEGYIYSPIIDRVTANYFETISDFEMKRKIQSPYTINFGGMDTCIKSLVDIFIVALQYGSITHIECIKDKLLSFLIDASLRYREHNMYLFTVKLLILNTNSKTLQEFMQTYGESTNHLNNEDILSILNSVERIKIPIKKIVAESLLLQYFGYYMSDEVFDEFTQTYLKKVTEYLKEHSLVSGFVPVMLSAFEKCQFRLKLQYIMKICYLIFSERYKRWYNDVFKILKYLSCFDVMPKTERKKLITWIKKQLKDKEIIKNCHDIGEAAQRIRQFLGEEAQSIDEVIKKCIPKFYDEIYALNVLKHDITEDWKYIQKLLEEIEMQNETQGKQGMYRGYAFNNYNIIANILIKDSVVLNSQQIKIIIKVMKRTLLLPVQTYQAKSSALYLLEVLQLKHKNSKQIRKLLIEIQNMDALWEGEETFELAYSKELLVVQWELFQVILNEKNNNGIDRIMPLFLSLDIVCQITLLDMIYELIGINSEDKGIERMLEILWPVLLTLEKSQNTDVNFQVGIIYANLCNSKYQSIALSRISVMLDDAPYTVKVGIISRLKNKCSDCNNIEYLLQKGRVDNHYWVRQVSK